MTGVFSQIGVENLQKYQDLAGKEVFQAIERASQKTGVNFAYLLEQAEVESGFDVDAKAKTSSATGLYQFIDQTWFETVAKHGFKHGLGALAQHVDFDAKTGRAVVADPDIKQQILDLRKDPETAANLAAEFAKDNQSYLEHKTETDIGETELYLAHFLGAGAAAKFINARGDAGGQQAAELFPAAAKANHAVFYERDGSARSLDQVYAFFDQKFSSSPAQSNAPVETQAIPGGFDFLYAAQDGDDTNVQAFETLASYALGSGSFGSAQDLYRVQNDLDVLLLSDIISNLTQHKNATRAYEASSFGRII